MCLSFERRKIVKKIFGGKICPKEIIKEEAKMSMREGDYLLNDNLLRIDQFQS